MIQLIIQCDKCKKAEIKLLAVGELNNNPPLSSTAGFGHQSAIRYAPVGKGKWCYLADIGALFCPDCLSAYAEHVESVDRSARTEKASFYDQGRD